MWALALCSKGSLMFSPKLPSRPAPSWAASMMPGPAPVIVMKPASRIFLAKATADLNSGSLGLVRALPKIESFRSVS